MVVFRASTKGRNLAFVPVRGSFFIWVQIVQTTVRSYKLDKERVFDALVVFADMTWKMTPELGGAKLEELELCSK